MKNKLILSGMLGLSVALVACGNGGDSASDAGDGTGTLQILLSEDPSDESALGIALNTWAEETGNSVDTLVIPYDDQLFRFLPMIQNDDAPDLVATTRLAAIYPEEFIDLRDVIDTDMFDQTALRTINQIYGSEEVLVAPNQYTVSLWFYNVDAFEEAGIEPPTEDSLWTLEELYENATLLQESGAVKYGLAVDYSRARYDNLMYSNGGSIVVEEDGEFLVNVAAEENVSTLEKFVELNDEGVMPRVIWTGGSADSPADYFQNGDVGIYLSGSWQYEPFDNNISDFEFAVMPSPMGEVQRSVIAGGSGLGIPSSADNAELAKEFLQWFYQEENIVEYITNDRGISFIEGITIEQEDEKAAADFEIIQNELNFVPEEFILDHQSGWLEHESGYRENLRRAVSVEMTAREALEEYADILSERTGWEKNE